jgi:hypothetical protein
MKLQRWVRGVVVEKPAMTTAAMVVTVIVITLAVADAAWVYFTGVGGSVSQWMVYLGFHSPMFVFGTGFVCGHFWGWLSPVDAP